MNVKPAIGFLTKDSDAQLDQDSETGSLDAATLGMSGVYIYSWRIALASAPTTTIKQVQTTAASNIFDGLTPGQVYQIEVTTVGTVGLTDWSGRGEKMVVKVRVARPVRAGLASSSRN